MAKVILNGCFGGYGWSNKAMLEVMKRKDAEITFTARVYYKPGEYELIPITEEDFLRLSENLVNHNHKFTETQRDQFPYVSDVYIVHEQHLVHGLSRTDDTAINVLEEFGTEFCSGKHSKLYVEEYDETMYRYEIDEYDGSETLEIIPLNN